MGVRNPNGIHHYLYDANHASVVTGAQRIMKGTMRRNGVVLNGEGDGGQNSYVADPYSRRDCEAKAKGRRAKLARPSHARRRDTIYVNPYYIVTHYSTYAEVTKHYYNGTARLAAALEADNDLSDIETSPTSIGVKTNLLNLLNMVGAQEGVDYQQQSLYGEEPQTYAQAVMSLEDYTTLINDNLEEDPGTPPEGQDRCTFSRYWPHQNHSLDCDPVIYFYHPNYLGHTEYITDRNGDAYQYFHYSAFGETLIEEHSGQGTHTDYFRFNGKELDPETGNYYYGARYYDPKISVWLSVDPLAEVQPQWSPYTFSFNNPIKYVDPDGRIAGDFYDENDYLIGTDGIDDNKVYVINTNKQSFTNGKDKIPGAGQTKMESYKAIEFVKNNSGDTEAFKENSDIYDKFTELPGTSKERNDAMNHSNATANSNPGMEAGYETATYTNSTTGKKYYRTRASVGQETTPRQSEVGSRFSPMEGKNGWSIEIIFHSHPANNSKGTPLHQPPSLKDVNNAKTAIRAVHARGAGKVFLYNQGGIQAVITPNTFRR